MNVEISKLSNGLTIVTDPMAGLESAAVGVWVNTGTRNETRPLMGISHMLEHMAFKGTATRSARAISEEIEAVGGYLNAYTSREQTAFHARILKKDAALAVDLLADILTAPAFEQSELERERQVVLQEIGQARDTPDDIVFDYLQSAAYADQPMGWSILGEEETVSAFSRDNLRDYMGANYRSGSMLLVSSGAVSHDEIVALAEEKFAKLPQGPIAAPQASRYTGGDMRVTEDMEQAHIVYAFPGLANDDPDYYIGQLYVTALGGGMSSRLFQEAREKRGLCYSIYAFSHGYQDGGVVGVYAGTGAKEAGEISAVIAGEMASIAGNLTEAEVARARAQLKSGLLMGLERPGTRTENIAGQIFSLGRIQPVEEVVAKIEEVDVAAVRRYAERTMLAAQPTIAAIGPIAALERHDIFAARFGGAPFSRAAE
ncbi:MAG TPA: pitrilysin family protein [Rhizomicrobium sp.]